MHRNARHCLCNTPFIHQTLNNVITILWITAWATSFYPMSGSSLIFFEPFKYIKNYKLDIVYYLVIVCNESRQLRKCFFDQFKTRIVSSIWPRSLSLVMKGCEQAPRAEIFERARRLRHLKVKQGKGESQTIEEPWTSNSPLDFHSIFSPLHILFLPTIGRYLRIHHTTRPHYITAEANGV